MTKIRTPVTAVHSRDYALAIRATIAVGTASVGLATVRDDAAFTGPDRTGLTDLFPTDWMNA